MSFTSPSLATSPRSHSHQTLLLKTTGTRPRIGPCRVGPRMSADQQQQRSSISLLTNITKLLWGPSLPPGLLISTLRTAWNTTWQLMMTQLAPSDPSGNYTRPASKFPLPNPYLPSTTRLHLYVGLPCPWAHRTLIVRALKGLEDAIPVSIASPGQDGSWEFKQTPTRSRDRDILIPGLDTANGCKNLKEVYQLRKGGYSGRASVPMLWDMDRKEVVCNESYDIIQLFNSGLNGLASNPGLDLAPVELKSKIEEWNKFVYPNINNGVYRLLSSQHN